MNITGGHKVCLITIILTITLTLSAQPLFSQNITINEHQAPLEKILKLIRAQSGYDILFGLKYLEGAVPVNISIRNATIGEALKAALKGQPFTYKLENGSVTIKQSIYRGDDNRPETRSAASITGRVTDEKGTGLKGVIIRVKNSSEVAVTGEDGRFEISGIADKATLYVSHIGYQPTEIPLSGAHYQEIKLKEQVNLLSEVTITPVSTGYQFIPKERATGSFVLIDSALLNRKVSSNVLERLDGVTSGLIFNRNVRGNTPVFSIRDRSTIFSNASPLVILDNFPYDGDYTNINPMDVKSITVLKDAAASSIWGSRAGNGVIVITTYKGELNKKPAIDFSTNITVGNKPNQYYQPQLSNQEYISIEQYLFDKGRYNSKISSGYMSLSPAVEIMLMRRNNQITDARKAVMLDSIASHDNREDLNKYFYRKSLSKQYQLSANGGGDFNKYYISMGYDKNLASDVTTSFDRLTLNASNTLSLFQKKIELLTGVMFSSNTNHVNGDAYLPNYPYENVASPDGKALAITDGKLRLPYIDTAGAGKLLDWHRRPLEEIQQQYFKWISRHTNYRVNAGIDYRIIHNLRFSLSYTYDRGINDDNTNYGVDSYYTRDLINTFSQIDQQSGLVNRALPLGDIVTANKSTYRAHYGRGQISYENNFSNKHALNMIAGFEVKDYQSAVDYFSLYGYNPATATNLNATINPMQDYPYYYSNETSRIPLTIGNSGTIDRYRSYYINGSYTYQQKYVLSSSARRDESNLFGVKSNQKGVPLWSAGLAWNLSSESFYHLEALPYLKLRATYGYNGNVDKTTAAYLTTKVLTGVNDWNQVVLQITNPPNPSLRWEKVRNTNFGLDFRTAGNRLSGSIEYWIKDGRDLIGSSPTAPQTGVSSFTGNSANTRAKGLDVLLSSVLISKGNFKWQSTLLYNYNTDRITCYKAPKGSNREIVGANYTNPLEGYSYYSLFSYKWMGLDNTGSPLSLLNGKVSKDYTNISISKNYAELVYSGTATPKYYGSLRNSVSYRSWQLSVNVTYKFDYFFRKPSLNNLFLYQGNGYAESYQQADYRLRWQKPGDEQFTNVPALIYPARSSRDDVYTYSDILVEKGDHIRLQDVRLDYQLKQQKYRWLPFSSISFYVYASNLGIIWKATKTSLDPDFPRGIPLPLSTALGFKANF